MGFHWRIAVYGIKLPDRWGKRYKVMTWTLQGECEDLYQQRKVLGRVLALTLENMPYRSLEDWLVIGDQGVVHLTSTQMSTSDRTNCILNSASQGPISCTEMRWVVSLYTPKQVEWDLVSLVLNTTRLYLHLIFLFACLFCLSSNSTLVCGNSVSTVSGSSQCIHCILRQTWGWGVRVFL